MKMIVNFEQRIEGAHIHVQNNRYIEQESPAKARLSAR